jgi:large-conductance mechanosensitive channel
MITLGDLIFQLFAFFVPITFIFIIIMMMRSSTKKKTQIEKLEARIEDLERRIK